jgi:hypothetical protein
MFAANALPVARRAVKASRRVFMVSHSVVGVDRHWRRDNFRLPSDPHGKPTAE